MEDRNLGYRAELLEKDQQNIRSLVQKAAQFLETEPQVALSLARKSAEAICKQVISHEGMDLSGRPTSTMVLEQLLDVLTRGEAVPTSIKLALRTIQSYGNFGAHDQGDENDAITSEYSRTCLDALNTVATWYFSKYVGGVDSGLLVQQDKILPTRNHKLARHGRIPGKTVALGLVALGLLAVGVYWTQARLRNTSGVAQSGSVSIQSVPGPTPVSIDLTGNGGARPELALPKDSDAKRIAILYFDNNSSDKTLDPLRTGLTDMLITDLNQIRSINVVEREKLNLVLRELRLQREKSIDPGTTFRIGKILGVEYLIMGSYFELHGQFRIDAKVVKVETGEIVNAEGVVGKGTDFVQLEGQLALRIASGLRTKLIDSEKNNLAPVKGPDLKVLLAYSQALSLFDEGKQQEALNQMKLLVAANPSFARAESALERIKKS